VVILELIYVKNPDFGRDVSIRLNTNALRGPLVIHDNSSNRMALCRRWFIQISSISTFDVGYWPNRVATGNGGLGPDPGEGA